MGNLGIDYQSLTQIKPDLVMASMSAYGATGPWANVPGIGGTIEPSSGMSSLLGYPGEHPLNSGQMYPDPVAGLCGFAAIALAPQGIFRTTGEDQWIAIAVETDEQWSALCEILRIDGTKFQKNEHRKANEATVDALVADAARTHDKLDLAGALLRRGIVAAPVLNPAEVAEDRQLRERGTMVEVDHPECGRAWQAGLAARLSRTPGGVTRHAPLQGQHSLEVFRELIDMSDEEYASLVSAEISGVGPASTSTVENQA